MSRTAHAARRRIFGTAYDHAPAHERPAYGALNFRRQVVGAAPRFGSSHFRLTGAALRRATFCYPDSAAEPSAFGVAAGMSLIELPVGELRRHPDFRGPEFVALGARIAEDGHLDPRTIGDAVRTGRHEPQDLKKVWHCLARFGAPRGAGTALGGHTPRVGTPGA